MKVLITGATGLVGQHLIPYLLKQGYAVNFLTTRKEAVNSQSNCSGFYWNIEKKHIDLHVCV